MKNEALLYNYRLHTKMGKMSTGLGHFPRIFSPGLFPSEKNANNVGEIEAGMIKQYFSSSSWIDETIRC